MINMHIKFEILRSPTTKTWKAMQNVEFGWFWAIQGPQRSHHPYSTLTETMHLSCTVFKL